MVNVKKLKARMVFMGYSNSSLAVELGVTPQTFSKWMRDGVFRTDFIEKICDLLKIKKPEEYFFCKTIRN